MYYEIFKFELKYRLKRPETYFFFLFLFAFAVFGVDFVFQGVERGLVKLNAPIVIAKTMGVLTGFFMILASLIMGMPMIRDDRYQITSLIYSNPIKKFDLLAGRFLGSFIILILIFCGIPLGMMIGEFMPWHDSVDYLPFRLASYLSAFSTLLFPTLFFGASLFFVTGMLSRKLLVVYTQGIFIFVIFLLTKSITDDFLQALLDPFSLTTTTQLTKEWSTIQKNTLLLPFNGVLLWNKLFWLGLGVLSLCIGYVKFNFTTLFESKKSPITNKANIKHTQSKYAVNIDLPNSKPHYSLIAHLKQFVSINIFFTKILLKEMSFWAIVICATIIIVVNSINLGTVYGVDSYPTTYFIVEELQELSIYFFIIIMLFYTGELFWKEREVKISPMCDATPISSLITLGSKMTALINVFIVLMMFLIVSGIVFQMISGYSHYDISIYFSGFLIEILPFLVIYTFAAFFVQALVNNKFLGILVALIFFVFMIALEGMGYKHVLFNFGGSGLERYSEMNGYGHFMKAYLLMKSYWFLFGLILLIVGALIMERGVKISLRDRLLRMSSHLSMKIKILGYTVLLMFILIGGYIYYQSNILNEVWTDEASQDYRANYEKALKHFEYIPQVKIVESNLNLELYPESRSYKLKGEYILKNEEDIPISNVHIQKQIESDILMDSILFSVPMTIDSQFSNFEYIIYRLETPLQAGDSLSMQFTQYLKPKGFNVGKSSEFVLENGTFIRNNEFPTIGYTKKYELSDEEARKIYKLEPRPGKAEFDDVNEIRLPRSGSDSNGMRTRITIGTSKDQIAVTSGNLLRSWKVNDRNYFEYRTDQKIINFYSILSARYAIKKDKWSPKDLDGGSPVDLEIYYHPRHSYNLDRMMKGMKASLDYYSSAFSNYQYKQLRIVEFPRYKAFAQSFPNTIPFSESIGFMLDIDDETDVDMTFFVTAHEIAHQWWGMQVETANVKGRNFVLETLSQYSALMVLKQYYGQAKAEELITLQNELYEEGKKKSTVPEVPLYLVENEEYIYYNKGIVVMNELQELIGEDNVNQALQYFIRDWNSSTGRLKTKTKRYATSENLIEYILDCSGVEDKEKVLELLVSKS